MSEITKKFDECYDQAMEENQEDFDRAVEIMLEKNPGMDENELMDLLAEEEGDVAEYYAKLAEECRISDI